MIAGFSSVHFSGEYDSTTSYMPGSNFARASACCRKGAGQQGVVHLGEGLPAVGIEVADRGPGIPPSEVEGLFTPFRRSPGVRGVPGFGVGLAVARGLVEAHGGRIWGGNRPDGGARFAFSLPLGDPGSTSGGHTAR